MKKSKFRKNKVKEYTESLDIIDDIGALNEKYIKLFIDLHNHWSIVDENFYLAAQKALTEQYFAELLLKRAQSRHLTEEKFYLAESKTSALSIWSRRKWFKWRNSPMKEVLDAHIAAEAGGYLSELWQGVQCDDPEPEHEEVSQSVECSNVFADIEDEEIEDSGDEFEELHELEEDEELENEVTEDFEEDVKENDNKEDDKDGGNDD